VREVSEAEPSGLTSGGHVRTVDHNVYALIKEN